METVLTQTLLFLLKKAFGPILRCLIWYQSGRQKTFLWQLVVPWRRESLFLAIRAHAHKRTCTCVSTQAGARKSRCMYTYVHTRRGTHTCVFYSHRTAGSLKEAYKSRYLTSGCDHKQK